jgi:hypothetical protein
MINTKSWTKIKLVLQLNLSIIWKAGNWKVSKLIYRLPLPFRWISSPKCKNHQTFYWIKVKKI